MPHTPMRFSPVRHYRLLAWLLPRWAVLLSTWTAMLLPVVHPAWGAESAHPTGQAPPAHLAAGLQAFQRGDIEQAASRWREAVRFYAEAHQPQAQSVVLTHLARAYEALGHYSQAAESLHKALQLAEAGGDHPQRALILGHRGHLALAMGELGEAERLLRDALALAQEIGQAGLLASLLHTQGNLFMARQQPQEAMEAYRHSAARAEEAQQFGVAARALAHAALAAERQARYPTTRMLLDAALAHVQRAEASHDTAYDILVIGRAYHRLIPADPSLLLRAHAVFTQAAHLAQTLQDHRALSYAWGYLGRLYEETHRYQEALDLTRRAVLAAQQVHVPEALYLWQWQTGRLLRALGDLPPAMAAYERAMATVQSMRIELLRGASGGPFSFRASLGPLYFELVDLLLQRAAELEVRAEEASYPLYEWYLHQARVAVEQFKTAELRDYFGDACVAAAQPRLAALERVAPDTAIVYPILLANRTELLLSLPSGLKRITVAVTGGQLADKVRVWRIAVSEQDPVHSLTHAQDLYAWLLRPLEADLVAWRIQTLVVVPDGALRLLPFAALHDGQRFLIEKYALAVTPSLTLTEPQPLPRSNVQALVAGITQQVEDAPALPHVTEELQRIQQLYDGILLLDSAFSPERLDTTLQQGNFGIVHIATHGHFAPDVSQSFLVTAQGKLTMTHLAQIVGRLRFREQPLELLTLSACETAKGDDRAALGLAGVAIQAGARSALATLWLVADDAAAVLMTAFYQRLKEPGMSRARALQQAQVALLNDPQYADPFFWAPFLLINNWL